MKNNRLRENATLMRLRSGFTLIQLMLTLLQLILVVIILAVLLALFLPPATRSREAARRTQCKNNLKSIGLALQQYQSDHGVFPPAYTVDDEGQRLHSWRTLILPYLDQKELYDSIDFSKPWNHPANSTLQAANIWAYRCPSSKLQPEQTTYLGVVTDKSCLRPGRSVALSEITDGPGMTLMVFEAPIANAVPWMSPADADEAIVLVPAETARTIHTGGRHVLMADGSVKFLSDVTSSESRQALVTPAGNEKEIEVIFD